MYNQKSIYFLGIAFLLIGLLWLHSGHLIHSDSATHEETPDNHTEDINLKFSLLGLIPTLLGVYLIDKHNRSLGRH